MSIVFAGISLATPKHAFDVIFYLGCVFDATTDGDWPEIQRQTYDHLKASIPERTYRELTESPPGISLYRSIVATDPEAFRQQLHVACYKLGFIVPVIGLTYLGVDPYLATRIMAAIPAALAFALVAVWLLRKLSAPVAIPIAIAGLLAGLFQTARYEYPDGLTALAIAGALISFTEGRRRLACICFLAAMIVRMDAILYFGAFLGVATFLATGERRMRFREAVAWGLGALVLYAAISIPLDTPSYQAVYFHSFISQQPYMMTKEFTVTPTMFADILVRQVHMVANKSAKYPMLIALALIAYGLTFRSKPLRPYGETALLSLLMVCFHFVFIPWFDTRYYAAPYMMIVCCFGVVIWFSGAELGRAVRLKKTKET
ncbi:hypothetical protein EOI86_09585 [Hwanghaeella grinnelliae]|uniref:Glycosyltransferase RgtA/B/C/D-like domain-containing protein n=1 Tax=Hwanghaeella grinnelliae TaxID=2500179 RepID=A0A3S2VQV1_9PROT|nr:hypothetical protein [Hwanghaeella grinnelliae]RVU39463.1 hypothetical protein EOI86_09585 [Hwanghaeella grinnelliae]